MQTHEPGFSWSSFRLLPPPIWIPLIAVLLTSIAVAVFSVPVFARIVRASTLSLKQAAYVEAVRCAGAPDSVIILRHILPGTLSSVIVYFTMRIGTSILTAAGLSFIGLGPEPDVPEWGNILAMSRSMMMAGSWHMSVFPGLAIFITVLAFNLLGDWPSCATAKASSSQKV